MDVFGSRLSALLLAVAIATASSPLDAEQRSDRTGTRTGSNATGRTIVQLGPSGDIQRILSLLQADRTDEAIALAEDYLDGLSSANFADVGANTYRYDALNALCVALTKAGRLTEALERCNEAVDLQPSRWSAINNRGTARFAQGNFIGALEDYQQALEHAHTRNDRASVEHNIELAEERLAELDSDR